MSALTQNSRHAKLAFVGDVMLGRLVSQHLRQRAPEWVWGDVLDLMKSADAVFANLECALTHLRTEWRRTPKAFHFRADPSMIEVLRAGNVSFVSLANNHALDCERDGLSDMLKRLDEAGIAHAGAGEDAVAAARPAFVRAGPIEVATFAVTDNMPEAGAAENEPGIAYIAPDIEESGPTQDEILNARRAGADLVVVSAHLGPNMVSVPGGAVRAYKRRLAARGADIVQGHSAHVVQGLERLERALILHDTGDFIDDYAVDSALRNDLSFLFLVDADKTGLRRVRLIPVRLHMAQVRLAQGADADWICERMQTLSDQFGVELARTREGLELHLPGAGGAACSANASRAPEAAT